MTAANCRLVPDERIPVEEERKSDEDAAVADEEGMVAARLGIQQQQRTATVYKACMLRNANICIKKVQYGLCDEVQELRRRFVRHR